MNQPQIGFIPIIFKKLNIEAISDATLKHLYQQKLKQKINENKIQNKIKFVVYAFKKIHQSKVCK